ncbi:hypothetical protein [Brevundimonas sp.]|uniref:hypothetical protein n=1 Tax=Brevundimonas sp. TaxID=1871086 RepID=UPI0025B86E79|nr:hypothetical protein [Brevundimonas sp.]
MSEAIQISPFHHSQSGMTRYPPNVEQLTVEKQGSFWILTARRNDVTLRFPLDETDRTKLAALLSDHGEAS